MKRKDKKIKVFLVVALILFITIGYAALITTLNITGNSEIKNAKWDIHFANLVVDDTSVEATTPAAIDSNKTTVNYAVNLVKPGDSYSFTVDVVNEGTIDGMISTVTNMGFTAEQRKYVDYVITYVNGAELKEKDGLKAGATRSVKIQVKYKDDINPEDLPQEDKTLNLTFTVKYVQSDNTVSPDIPIMRAYIMNSTYDYHNDTYRNKVTKIVTKTNIDVPETAIKQWDVSAVGNGSVIAYIEDDGMGNGTYKVTIGGNGKVIANEDSRHLFYAFSSLKEVDLSNLDTSKVTHMGWMFSNCSSLTSLDVSRFDTRKVIEMGAMFYNCSSLTSLNVSKFNTGKVSNMNFMFRDCSSLTSLDLSKFNTINVTNMNSMFKNCSKLVSLDVSGFDTSKVTSMDYIFEGCRSLTSLDLSSFNTSNVTNMYRMFNGCSSLTSLDLSSFDTSKVTDMSSMFNRCSKLTTTITIKNSGISNYDTMFGGAATDVGSQITVNYTSGASELVDQMIATKSDTSNVVKGSLVS